MKLGPLEKFQMCSGKLNYNAVAKFSNFNEKEMEKLMKSIELCTHDIIDEKKKRVDSNRAI